MFKFSDYNRWLVCLALKVEEAEISLRPPDFWRNLSENT